VFVHFHGVRGSYPVPGKDTVRYGGNTSCVSFTAFNSENKIVRVIVDSGTGIINLGKEMISNFKKGSEVPKTCILFTHHHPDHTDGFMFFIMNFISCWILYLVGMVSLKKDTRKIIESAMTPPRSPIESTGFKSTRKNHNVSDGETFYILDSGEFSKECQTGSLLEIKTMQAHAPSHPQQGSMYYRIRDLRTNEVATCVWDNESHVGGDIRVINFAKDSDILIHDTQYTAEEYGNASAPVQGFGHSTYDMALENAIRSNSRTLMCFHYNPNHSDDMLDNIAKKINDVLSDKKTSPRSEGEPEINTQIVVMAVEGCSYPVNAVKAQASCISKT